MGIQRIHQASFVRGELDPKIASRVDVLAYEQGLKKARNYLVTSGRLIIKNPENAALFGASAGSNLVFIEVMAR